MSTEALKLARDALEEIALAGMSGTGEESPEAMNAWHARRAREFIGIAARALDGVRAALASPEPDCRELLKSIETACVALAAPARGAEPVAWQYVRGRSTFILDIPPSDYAPDSLVGAEVTPLYDHAAPTAQPQPTSDRIERLKFDLRQHMIDYGQAVSRGNDEAILTTTTAGCAAIDELASIAASQPQPEAPAEPSPSLIEAVDTLLEQTLCGCPRAMRFDRGEHLSGCHLFDLNLARFATPAPAAQQPAELTDEWYLQDTRTYVGNDVSWWAKDGKGYTTDISKAHIYTREAAFRQVEARGCDRAWPKAYIDSKTRPAVDMQYIDHEEAIKAQGGNQ